VFKEKNKKSYKKNKKFLNFSVNNFIPSERRDFKPVEKNIGFSVKQEATAL